MAFFDHWECDVGPEFDVVPHFDAHVDDRLDLFRNEVAGKSVLGDPHHHHATENVGCLIDGDVITKLAQIMSRGKTTRTATDDPNALGSLNQRRRRNLTYERRIT
ncbi:hypothetical protein BMS3Bbin02_01909 [bacterium BMS3Bbin02]|nr:hypothetical protein BMS3Bbin02_01909 [bacterium BMS3Bbin02]